MLPFIKCIFSREVVSEHPEAPQDLNDSPEKRWYYPPFSYNPPFFPAKYRLFRFIDSNISTASYMDRRLAVADMTFSHWLELLWQTSGPPAFQLNSADVDMPRLLHSEQPRTMRSKMFQEVWPVWAVQSWIRNMPIPSYTFMILAVFPGEHLPLFLFNNSIHP